MKKLVFLGLILAMACNKGGDSGGGGDKGKNNQKVDSAGSNALSGQAALLSKMNVSLEGKKKTQGDQVVKADLAGLVVSTSTAAPKYEQKEAIKKKQSVLDQRLTKKNCQMKVDPTGTSSDGVPQSGKVVMSGPQCPVESTFEVKIESSSANPCAPVGDATQCLYAMTVRMDYRVLDETLKKELETVSGSFAMKANIDFTTSRKPSKPSDGSNMRTILKGDMDIEIKSVGLEDLSVLLLASLKTDMEVATGRGSNGIQSMKGFMEEKFDYTNQKDNSNISMSARMVADGGNNPTASFVINGQAATEEEYLKLRDVFGNKFAGNAPGPKSPDQGGGIPDEGGDENDGDDDPVNGDRPQDPGNVESGSWICTAENHLLKRPFIGVGKTKQIAESQTRTQCSQSSKRNGCTGLYFKCDNAGAANSWYCEASSDTGGFIFNSIGESKVLATFRARNTCINDPRSKGSCSEYNVKCMEQ